MYFLDGSTTMHSSSSDARLHDGVAVREQRAVAVAEVEPPDLDVLVGGAAHEQAGVGRHVHGQHRQLVPVQGQEELEAVQEEHLARGRSLELTMGPMVFILMGTSTLGTQPPSDNRNAQWQPCRDRG